MAIEYAYIVDHNECNHAFFMTLNRTGDGDGHVVAAYDAEKRIQFS